MKPILNLEVLSALPRTLQRWEWERLDGGLVVLGGFVIFVGAPPDRAFRLEVEMYGAGGLIGTTAARLDPGGADWLPVSPMRAEFITEEEPPYRLRVQFVNESLPPRSRRELLKSAEAQVRPWVRRELPSSS
jgi:hypothetical protein